MLIVFIRTTVLSVLFIFIAHFSFAQPGNDNCSGATVLTSFVNTCSATTNGTLANATNSNVAANATCGGTPDDDVWYAFQAINSTTTITLTNISNGNNKLGNATPTLELFSGTCLSALTSLVCVSTAPRSITYNSLTIGVWYYVRVYSGSLGFPSSDATFSICVTHPTLPQPPANDECSSATSLTVGTTNSSGTVWGATGSTGITTGCATGTADDDVWYRFSAPASTASVTLSSIGGDLSTSGARIQAFSGSCGSLTSIACGSTSLNLTGLITGTQYYLRVYSAGSGSIGGTASGSAFSINVSGPATLPNADYQSSRMKEVFKQTTLSGANLLNDPWEIAYGPDGNLWITEAKGYRVYKMDPSSGVKTTVLDISTTGTGYLTASEHTAFNMQSTFSKWPQGGLAGLAIHPEFTNGKQFIYLSYVHRYIGLIANSEGHIFVNRVVRFTYNESTNKLESPVSLCDTLPGSSDHNSQRMIIAPVNGIDYLFYASGDMGAGQFENKNRPMRAQVNGSYEGKILRFNLEPDGDAGTLDKWIPNNNPFNGASQSAVWSTGMRNNQGFAYAEINGVGRLFGSSHGPFSDDEINIIEQGKNYGHPIVIGYANDENYKLVSAGEKTGILPVIGSEITNASTIGSSYKDPLFSGYAPSNAAVTSIWNNQVNNGAWPSEAWSGMDIYTDNIIPGWKNSLVIASLKWGRVLRFKLGSSGSTILPIGGSDTLSYFGGINRFRDMAFAPGGKDLFVIMDKSATTSGPSALNPVVPACGGCVLKYTFLGYNSDGNGKSMIPTSIDVTEGTDNTCAEGTTITIDDSNKNLWVPITGPDGNIMAEIKANGNNLGTVTSTFYTNAGSIREDNNKNVYLNRNLTINPQYQPSSPVNIRLYITANELASLQSATNSLGAASGVTGISDLSIFKNDDACGAAVNNGAIKVVPLYVEAHGSNGYVLQATINSFSSFYFASDDYSVLPLQLITFKGEWKNNAALLQWETVNENNTAEFIIERSIDGSNYSQIGSVNANGNTTTKINYSYIDNNAASQPAAVIFYRLKLVDQDGRFTYSKSISIDLKNILEISLFPNPVKDKLNIRINNRERQTVTLEVTDLQGRKMFSERRTINPNESLEINVKAWKSQFYVLKVLNEKKEVISVVKFGKM